MKIGITGATGQLGRLTIEALKASISPANIIALARNPENIADLGIEARRADYRDNASFEAALQGVDVVILISSNDFRDRVGQHQTVIAAAKAARVKHIVYTSMLKAGTSPLLVVGDHKATEELIFASGLAYTILRNPWYTENWTGSLPVAIKAGAVIGSAGDARVSPATRLDLAEALAKVATGEGHANRIYELGGDESFTLAELAAEVSAQTGQTIPYQDLPKDVYLGILASFGLPPGVPEVIADADALAAGGWLLEESRTLSRLIGRPTTTLKTAVAAALAT
jgi:NAD(P)H dehydrogenase (quinone)